MDVIAGFWSISVKFKQWKNFILKNAFWLMDKEWKSVVEDKYEIFIGQNRY
jgi:hypothetical protein